MTNCVLCENDYDTEDGGEVWSVGHVNTVGNFTMIHHTRITVCPECSSWLENAVETTAAKS